MAVDVKVRVEGLAEFRREIKKVDPALGKELRQVHVKVADLVVGRVQAAVPADVRAGIRSRATQKSAFVQTRTPPARTLGVIWGMRYRSGWYAKRRYQNSRGRQFEPWVGNQWDPGDAGGKPYFVGDVINASIDDVIDVYGDELEQLAAKAFPTRG